MNQRLFNWRKINKPLLSQKHPWETGCWTLIQPLFGSHSLWSQECLSHMWRREEVGFTQPGREEPLSPWLSWKASRSLPPGKGKKKKKKKKSFCPFYFDSHQPHPYRMTFNNQLAFQLLNIRAVSRGARGKRSPRDDPEQLTWLPAAASASCKFAPKLDLPSTLLLNNHNKIPQCRPYPGGGEVRMAPWGQRLAQAAQSWLALRHVTLMLCSSWSM